MVGEGACTYFRTGSFAAGARLAHAISQLAGLDDDHPAVDLQHAGVTVRLITATHDYYGLSQEVRERKAIGPAHRDRLLPPSARSGLSCLRCD